MPEGLHKPRQTLPEQQMERMKNGQPGNKREVVTMFVRGWEDTGRYSLMRDFFEGLGIQSSWIREMTWTSAETLQIMVQERYSDEIKSKIRGHGKIFVDEKFDWDKVMAEKSMKRLEDTLVGISKQIGRLGEQSMPVQKTLTTQRDRVEVYLDNLQRLQQQQHQQLTKALTQLPGSRDGRQTETWI